MIRRNDETVTTFQVDFLCSVRDGTMSESDDSLDRQVELLLSPEI